MADIVNISTFLGNLSYLIKVGIYINKGTDQDAVLEKCIKLYNKYKTIETSLSTKSADKIFVRKCLKRLNLTFKVDELGNPVDLSNKENQIKMVFLKEHSSILNNDMESMLEYANKHKINVVSGIPLTFILRDGIYQKLLWQYVRYIFYITQILISKEDSQNSSGKIGIKAKILEESMEKIESILEELFRIEEEMKLSKILSLDKFLNNRLIKGGITAKEANKAKKEILGIFSKKGVKSDEPVYKILDRISERITDTDLTGEGAFQKIINISFGVVKEVKDDIGDDPEKLKDSMSIMKDIFMETLADPEQNEHIPENIKQLSNIFLQNTDGDINEDSAKVIAENIDKVISSDSGGDLNPENVSFLKGLKNCINKKEIDVFKGAMDDNGEINIGRLKDIVKKQTE